MKWAAFGYLVTQSLIQNVKGAHLQNVSVLDLNWIVSLAIDKDCRLEEAVWGCLAYSDAHVMVHNSSLQEEQYLAVAAEADAAIADLPSEVGHCSQRKVAAPTCVRLCSTKNMRLSKLAHRQWLRCARPWLVLGLSGQVVILPNVQTWMPPANSQIGNSLKGIFAYARTGLGNTRAFHSFRIPSAAFQ